MFIKNLERPYLLAGGYPSEEKASENLQNRKTGKPKRFF